MTKISDKFIQCCLGKKNAFILKTLTPLILNIIDEIEKKNDLLETVNIKKKQDK